MSYRYEFQRWQRLLWPSRYDHAAYMLIGICGRYWLLLTGWKREFKILTDQGWLVLDLAHPRLKLCLEADGERWHRDIVHEFDRDSKLLAEGWAIRHYRYPRLKNEPRKVRREVRGWFYRSLILGIRR